MWQETVKVRRLPLNITYYTDGTISFEPYTRFDVFIDQVDAELQVIVNEQQITLGNNEHIGYNEVVRYKDNPKLLKWLQSLQLDMPRFQ